MAVNEKDKYYTPDWLVEHTIKKAIEIIGKENITEVVEPSAGDGAFIEQLKKNFNGILLRFYDLYPEHPEVIEQDYKKVRLSYKKGRLTIGNPPFGTSSCLWKAFCKKAATNSDYIVFISPASQYNSNYYFKEGELVYSELLNDVEYRGSKVENGKNQKVRTCLNIYKVYDRDEVEDWRLQKINSIVKYGRVYNYGIGEKEYEYYLQSLTMGRKGKLCKVEDYYGTYGITILDEKYRNRIEEFLNSFNEKYEKELKNNEGMCQITNHFFTSKLKTFLFPTREERLEQDVKIEGWDYRHPHLTTNLNDFDFFIDPYSYKLLDKNQINEKKCGLVIKVLNKNMYDKIKDAVIRINEQLNGDRIIFPKYKEELIKHLYPTREERLEQDVLIEYANNENFEKYDFLFEYRMRCAGILRNVEEKYSKYLPNMFGIIILNKNKKEEIINVLKGIREKLEDFDNIEIPGARNSLNINVLKDYLIKHLYPEDEYPEFDYLEVKKPIHIERAIYAKELF